jgi:hypothetical protein
MIAIRIIASPFVFAIAFIASIKFSFKTAYLFLRYGGEFIPYQSKDERKTIFDLYNEIKEQHNK